MGSKGLGARLLRWAACRWSVVLGGLALGLILLVSAALQGAMAVGGDDSSLLSHQGAIMLLVDPGSGDIVDANGAAARFYGYSQEDFRRMNIRQLHALGAVQVLEEQALARRESRNYFLFPHRLADGSLRTVEVYSSPITLESGRQVLFSIIHDVTHRTLSPLEQQDYQHRLETLLIEHETTLAAYRRQEVHYFLVAMGTALGVIALLALVLLRRRRAERALAHREEQLSTLINAMPDIVCFKDGAGRWQQANTYDLALFGLTGVDYQGKKDSELAIGQDFYRESFLGCEASDEEAWRAGRTLRREEIIPIPGAPARVFDIIKVPLFNPDGSRKGLVVIGRDITERKAAEAQVDRLAYFDSLTDLPNRRLLFDRLGTAITAAQHSDRQGAVLFVDLDDFNTLNDARGHESGDHVLRETALRIRAVLEETDTVARFSADEFVVLVPELNGSLAGAAEQARQQGERIRQALAIPFQVAGEEVSLGASIGIALFPTPDRDGAKDLVKFADTAMHQAKAAGRNQVRFFELDMQARVEARFALEGDLRHALARQQMRIYVQPQVNGNGRTVGGEVLLRWEHPERGLVGPVSFIPVAEETGLIVDLGEWVLEQACLLLTQPPMQGSDVRISVNVSPRQFHRPDFVVRVKAVLARSGADPHCLTLEVTEGLVIDNLHQTVATMSELRALGIHFSIDDFGTGYSSLSYLKCLPINELKIDKTFVQDAPEDTGDAGLVDVILAVARHMNLKVVAEGVETPAQAAFLAARGEMLFQGYLFGRPMPEVEFLQRLR